MIPILETERLILRPFVLSDAPSMSQLAGHPDIAATTLNMPSPYSEEVARAFIESVQDNSKNHAFAIVRKRDQQLLGGIGIHPHERHLHAEVGYWIGVPYWNNGYATEAVRRIVDHGFEDLKLNRIYAGYFSENIASRRVMEKADMIYEGTFRQHYERFGKFHDVGYLAILRDEWEART
jgi:RimJ/RimL family protein N-acetyltransferase